MKASLLIMYLFCMAGAVFAQRVSSSCDAPDSVKKRFQDEAAWLAFQAEQITGSPFLDSAIFQNTLQDKFLKAILTVYNVADMKAADTVMRFKFANDYYRSPHLLRSYRYYSMEAFEFNVDTSVQWEYRFSKGLFPTGNSALDSFIERYVVNFDTIYYQFYQPGVLHCSAYTRKSYNMIVFDSLLNLATGNVLAAQPIYVCCDGDRIDGNFQKDSSILLTFSFAWGDCYAGCSMRRSWDFTVFPDCSVRYDTVYGDAWPFDAVGAEPEINSLTVYPNPVAGKIIIETVPQSSIQIVDILGNIITVALSKDIRTEMNIATLPQGMYVVRATDRKGNHRSAKFIKE